MSEKNESEPREREMRETKVPWLKSLDELSAYIDGLVEQEHDYGTCCYAMSMAATAAFQYVAGKLGVTGFQASCADMDILRRTRGWEWGRIIDYANLLYPQYADAEHYPGVDDLLADPKIKDELSKRARAKLDESNGLESPNVRAWWESLASGKAVSL